jgi:hypothetical protein
MFFTVTSEKLGAEAVSTYVLGGICGNEYRPCESVVVARFALVLAFVTAITAPGTTPPEGSVTSPLSEEAD